MCKFNSPKISVLPANVQQCVQLLHCTGHVLSVRSAELLTVVVKHACSRGASMQRLQGLVTDCADDEMKQGEVGQLCAWSWYFIICCNLATSVATWLAGLLSHVGRASELTTIRLLSFHHQVLQEPVRWDQLWCPRCRGHSPCEDFKCYRWVKTVKKAYFWPLHCSIAQMVRDMTQDTVSHS